MTQLKLLLILTQEKQEILSQEMQGGNDPQCLASNSPPAVQRPREQHLLPGE